MFIIDPTTPTDDLASHMGAQIAAAKTAGSHRVNPVPARRNPAAVNYANRMLGRLARVGYTSTSADPVSAWADVSARFAQAAHAAGFADPREYVVALLRQQAAGRPHPGLE